MGQRWGTDNLAWRKNLSKTRAVMKISAPSRTGSGLGPSADPRLCRSANAARRLGRSANRPLRGSAQTRLFSAAIALGACLALACGDDDPAEQTGIGGSGGAELDASVRDLPGDGLEPTPDFDTESRQRYPIGPQRLVETVDEIRDEIDRGSSGEASDAGPDSPEPADGGAN